MEFNCHICGKPGYKTDGKCNIWCAECLGLNEGIKYAPINKEKKINRNELCPCGSGKKYKKCCLDNK